MGHVFFQLNCPQISRLKWKIQKMFLKVKAMTTKGKSMLKRDLSGDLQDHLPQQKMQMHNQVHEGYSVF